MVSCTSPLGRPVKLPGEFRPAKDAPIQWVSCGKCMACRLNHARNWATRIQHEATFHEENCFLTLTYSDENLPDPPSLSRRPLQLFFKSLRQELEPKRVRFFACGEYGDKLKRPHYHAILFGHAFTKDRRLWSEIRGNLYYRSSHLETLWPHGYCLIGDVTTQSAGYVARYAVKKANLSTASDHNPYERVNAQTGEVYQVEPEFLAMSRRPGIGFKWIDQYATDAFPSGFLISDGQRVPVPPAYRRRVKKLGGDALNYKVEEMEHNTHLRAIEKAADNTPERNATKDELLRLRASTLKRELE